MSRTISHLTEASIRLNDSSLIPMTENWVYDCGCFRRSRADGMSVWSLCVFHLGFEDGIDAAAAAIEAERDGAR